MWQNNVGLISEILQEVNDVAPTVSICFICTSAKDILDNNKSHISHICH